MIARTIIDGVRVHDATEASIRAAVAAGSKVILIDDAGIPVQIDQAVLAQIDDASKGLSFDPKDLRKLSCVPQTPG